MSALRRVVAVVGVLATTLVAVPSCARTTTTTGTSGTAGEPTTVVGSTAEAGAAEPEAPVRLTLRIVNRVPHDTAAFTEGLTFSDDGRLFESLGLEGESTVREVDPSTGEVLREAELPADQFGEGLAIRDGVLTQMTWTSGVVHRWSLDGLESLGTTSMTGEGWGLTYDGRHFVQSDGSSTLRVRDPEAFDPPVDTVEVVRDGAPVDELNELEWVDGVIWANVWHSDEILRIDPTTGSVTGVLDASALWQSSERTSEMTLNGIAHRPGDPPDRLWLTGKNWPEMFEVEVS